MQNNTRHSAQNAGIHAFYNTMYTMYTTYTMYKMYKMYTMYTMYKMYTDVYNVYYTCILQYIVDGVREIIAVEARPVTART